MLKQSSILRDIYNSESCKFESHNWWWFRYSSCIHM